MLPLLDTLKPHPYKPRALWLMAALWLAPAVASAEVVNGVQLPDGTQKVAENRYRAHQNFEETLKYYKSVYPVGSCPRKQIVNQPGIKAVHIAAPPGKGFEGLNIYEANDEVRIYVVQLGDSKPKKKETRPSKKS